LSHEPIAKRSVHTCAAHVRIETECVALIFG
jgi:hypothetical protein